MFFPQKHHGNSRSYTLKRKKWRRLLLKWFNLIIICILSERLGIFKLHDILGSVRYTELECIELSTLINRACKKTCLTQTRHSHFTIHKDLEQIVYTNGDKWMQGNTHGQSSSTKENTTSTSSNKNFDHYLCGFIQGMSWFWLLVNLHKVQEICWRVRS